VKAEIIPTVIDEFVPLLTISAFWENATEEVGNTINPARLQKQPDVQFIDHVPAVWRTKNKISQLTLALTDPDAPSRDNPEWSEICHWIVTNVDLVDPKDGQESTHATSAMKDIMPYKPPGPPPKTGKHRYVFVALAPKNATTEELNLRKPADRQHWGYDQERQGLKDWAEEMGLMVIGKFRVSEKRGIRQPKWY
jgi:phosphatidylethanolamine-binding protein